MLKKIISVSVPKKWHT